MSFERCSNNGPRIEDAQQQESGELRIGEPERTTQLTERRTMDIESLTLKEIREIRALFVGPGHPDVFSTAPAVDDSNPHPWQIGKPYLIRTVTMIQTGRLVRVTSQELVLEDACWIADTGRFADALKSREFAEMEPFPDGPVIVGRGSIIDAVVIGDVQRSQR